MIPPKPLKNFTLSAPRRIADGRRRLQVNTLFDTEAEMMAYLAINFKDQNPVVIRQWKREQIACEIELSDKPKQEKKRK